MTGLPNIAFVGAAGAGKSTCARVLMQRFPDLGYDVISFATSLKVMLDTETDRQRLQEFGTDVVRRYEPMAWVRLAQRDLELRTRIRELEQTAAMAVVTDPPPVAAIRWVNDDCRFENELAFLQDNGWAIIEVTAPRALRVERLKRIGKLTDESQLNHSSERSLGSLVPDATIDNGYGMDDAGVARALQATLEGLR